LLNLKLLNNLLSNKSNATSQIITVLTTKASEIFEKSISQITLFKLSNKIIHKEILDDEILSLSGLLACVLSSSSAAEGLVTNSKITESLQQIFALYYDNKDFMSLVYSKFLLISSNNNKNLNLNLSLNLKALKANLEACVSNFGVLPNGFGEGPVIKYYYKSLRPKLEKKAGTAEAKSGNSTILDDSAAEIDRTAG